MPTQSPGKDIASRSVALAMLGFIVVSPVALLLYYTASVFLSLMSTLTGLSLLEAHYTEVAAHSPVIEQAANRLRSELDASDGIYEDMTSSGASAKLIQSLKELIAAAGGEARTISIDPATSSTTLEKLHVSLDAILPPSRLGKVLELVQARRPYIFVETLELSAASFTSVQGQLWLKMKIAAFREIHHAPN